MSMTAVENEWYTRGFNAAKEIYDKDDEFYDRGQEFIKLRVSESRLKEAVEIAEKALQAVDDCPSYALANCKPMVKEALKSIREGRV